MPKKIIVCGACGSQMPDSWQSSKTECYKYPGKLYPVITKMDWGNHG